MKRSFIFFTASLLLVFSNGYAQQVNWRSLSAKQNNIAGTSLGWDYGTETQIDYGRKLSAKFPLVAGIELSAPLGKHGVDDYKTMLALQAEVLRLQHFSMSIKAGALFKRYQNDLVTMIDFGAAFSGLIGYYAPRWYVAGEFGLDKAVVTQLKNSAAMKEAYPSVQDGWYLPTGGHFSYGIASGYNFKRNGFVMRLGKTAGQDFKTNYSVPLYFQFGYTRQW